MVRLLGICIPIELNDKAMESLKSENRWKFGGFNTMKINILQS